LTQEKKLAIALAIAGISKTEFAKKNCISRTAIEKKLKGKINSPRIEKIINRFIDKQFLIFVNDLKRGG
jgi:hypothetical protein